MKNYFTTFLATITNPLIYRQLLQQRLKSSLQYFLISYLLISIVLSLFVTIFLAPDFYQTTQDVQAQLAQYIPDDAVVQLDQNRLSLQNAPSPLKIPTTNNPNQYLVIIDPDATAEDIKRLNTAILLTSNAFAINTQKPNDARIVPWRDFQTQFRLTKPDILQEFATFQNGLTRLRPFLFVILLIPIFIILSLSRLFFALVYTLGTSAVGTFLTRPFPYRSYLSISLHIMPLAEVLSLLEQLIYGHSFPQFFSIVFLGVSFIAILSLPKAIRIKT
jgi:hypothetical protein